MGLKLGNIHKVTKATDGVLLIEMQLYLWSETYLIYLEIIRKGENLAGLDFKRRNVDYGVSIKCNRFSFVKSQVFHNFEVSKKSHDKSLIIAR